MSGVFCVIEILATGRSLVQRSLSSSVCLECGVETSYVYLYPSYVYKINVRTDLREVISHARTEFCVYLLTVRTLLLVL